MYKGIEHTAIATPDPEALARWYKRTLEFPIVHRFGGNVFIRAADGSLLELIPSKGERVEVDVKSPGIRHLAVSVDDIEAGVADLESKGVEIFERADLGGNRLAFFRDPDGNILHLIWREQTI